MERYAFWTTQVPPHWDIVDAGRLFREVSRKSHPKEPLLSVTQDRGVIPRDQLEERVVMPQGELDSFKLVRQGNFVISLRSADGGIEYSAHRGLVSPAYIVMEPSSIVNHGYFRRLLKAGPVVRALSSLVTGIRDGKSIPYAQFRSLPLLVPPALDQEAISRFLDEKERDIEHYLATKRRMIEVLEEQRGLAVERVLKRSTSAHPSSRRSVPWFGDVPSSWRTFRLKHVASHIVDCLHETPDYLQGADYPAIRTADVVPGRLDLHRAKRVDRDTWQRRIERLKPQGGDIVYSREGERFGIAAPVPPGVDLCVSQRMMHFRIRPDFDAEYIMWLLNSRAVYLQASVDQNGATAPHVNVERIRNFLLVLPELPTQREIVRMVEREVAELDAAVLILEREIAAMEEYRTRLIADAVTGQIDVRRAT
jgi:type I restriction enzyme S subunit